MKRRFMTVLLFIVLCLSFVGCQAEPVDVTNGMIDQTKEAEKNLDLMQQLKNQSKEESENDDITKHEESQSDLSIQESMPNQSMEETTSSLAEERNPSYTAIGITFPGDESGTCW